MIKLERNIALFETLKAEGVEPLNMSHGNKKLVSNDKTAFLVWNLPAVTTCPFATNHCKGACYARKAENAYPDVLPARQRNFLESRQNDFVKRAVFTILKRMKYAGNKKVIVRVHESGDFYNGVYTLAWLKIAEILRNENVTFIAYTKSFRYFDGVKLPKAFKLRASVWDDTKPEELEIIRRNNWNIYTAVEKFEKGDSFTRCRCSDCATCGKCWKNYKDIRCEIH